MVIFFHCLQNEWVICRVFHKNSEGKKIPISGLVKSGSFGSDSSPNPTPQNLPPLTDSSSSSLPLNGKSKPVNQSAYVPCFSNLIDPQKLQGNSNSFFSNSVFSVPLNNIPNTLSVPMAEQSLLRALLENQSWNMKQNQFRASEIGQNSESSSVMAKLVMDERSYDDQVSGMEDLEYYWNY